MMGMRQSAQEPGRERSRNVWKPAAIPDQTPWFSSSLSLCLPFIFPVLLEHLFAEVMFTSPAQVGGTWWGWNIQKTKVVRQALFKHLQCHSYLVHKQSKRGVDSVAHDLGPRVPGAGCWVTQFSSGHECSPHILSFQCGSPKKESPMTREYVNFIKGEERFFFSKCSLKGPNHTLGLWYFNSSSVH